MSQKNKDEVIMFLIQYFHIGAGNIAHMCATWIVQRKKNKNYRIPRLNFPLRQKLEEHKLQQCILLQDKTNRLVSNSRHFLHAFSAWREIVSDHASISKT